MLAVFLAANCQKPSTAAADAMSFADNFLQKQQKQQNSGMLSPAR